MSTLFTLIHLRKAVQADAGSDPYLTLELYLVSGASFYFTVLRSSIRLTVALKVPCCFKIMFPFTLLPLSGMIFSPPWHTYRFAKPSSFAILGKRFSMTLFLLSFLYLKRSSIISLILLDCHFLFM